MNPPSTSLRVARWVPRVMGIILVPIAIWTLLMPGASAFIEIGSQAVQRPGWAMATLIPVVGILVAVGAGLATWVAVRLLRDPRAEMAAVRAMANASQGGGAWVVSGTLPKLGASSDMVDGWPEQ
jgi:hypothetical protein